MNEKNARLVLDLQTAIGMRDWKEAQRIMAQLVPDAKAIVA